MLVRNFIFRTLLVLMLFAVSPVSAQDSAGAYAKGQPLYASAPFFNLQFSSDFGFMPGMGSLFSHSLSPSVNWEIGRRFSLQAGTIFATTHMNGPGPLFPYTPHMAGGEAMGVMETQRLFGATVFASAAYQVNERLTLIGTGWMQKNDMPGWDMNAQAFDLQSSGMMFGFDYQVSDNLRFGAEMKVSNGYNPFLSYPSGGIYQHGFYSPSPFHRGSRW